jgi:hypothetical protein
MGSFIERLLKPLRKPRVRLAQRVECEQLALGTEYGGYAVCPVGLIKTPSCIRLALPAMSRSIKR